MVVLLGANNLFIATDNGISAEPVLTFARSIAGRGTHFSHQSIRALTVLYSKLVPSPVRGVHVIGDFLPFICDPCEYVKMTRKRAEQQAQVHKCPSLWKRGPY